MSTCVFPGSFDPFTCGHLNLIERASALFDLVTVVVMVNRSKNGTIPYEERARLIRKACGKIKNIRVEIWYGLLADYMREHEEHTLVRGVRSAGEFDKEMLAAEMNSKLFDALETVFLPAAPKWSGVSSSAVKEIASFGGDISPFVPGSICPEVLRWLKPEKAND